MTPRTPRPPDKAAALAETLHWVYDTARLVNTINLHLSCVAAIAHRSGASWAQIGEAAGMSAQSAHQRWASFNPNAPMGGLLLLSLKSAKGVEAGGVALVAAATKPYSDAIVAQAAESGTEVETVMDAWAAAEAEQVRNFGA